MQMMLFFFFFLNSEILQNPLHFTQYKSAIFFKADLLPIPRKSVMQSLLKSTINY